MNCDSCTEEWRDIPNYIGLYKVSNFGRIYSCINNKILKPEVGNYSRILLHKNKKAKHFYVHVLTANAFIGNRTENNIVHHKDGNKLNNNSNNLEYCSQSENSKYYLLSPKAKVLNKRQ